MGQASLVTVLSLGFMVFGIGCIFWSIFSIWAHSDYSAYATRSSYSIPTTFVAEQSKLTEDYHVQVESVTSLVLPALDKPLYPVYPAGGDNIGSLTIPALERKLPILQGTGVKELEEGVGPFIKRTSRGR